MLADSSGTPSSWSLSLTPARPLGLARNLATKGEFVPPDLTIGLDFEGAILAPLPALTTTLGTTVVSAILVRSISFCLPTDPLPESALVLLNKMAGKRTETFEPSFGEKRQ